MRLNGMVHWCLTEMYKITSKLPLLRNPVRGQVIIWEFFSESSKEEFSSDIVHTTLYHSRCSLIVMILMISSNTI